MSLVSYYVTVLSQQLAIALGHAIWAGAVIGFVALVIGLLLSRAKPWVRYWTYLLGLVLMAATLPAAFVLTFDEAVLSLQDSRELMTQAAYAEPTPMWRRWFHDPVRAAQTPWAPQPEPKALHARLLGFGADNVLYGWRRLAPAVGLLYSFGVMLLCWRLGRALRLSPAAAVRLHECYDPGFSAMLHRAVQRVGVGYIPWTGSSPGISAPALVGTVCPAIVLPEALVNGAKYSQLEKLLVYLLVHIRFRHTASCCVQWLLEGILFFHPAAWLLARMARRERERQTAETVWHLGGETYGYYVDLMSTLQPARPAEEAAGAPFARINAPIWRAWRPPALHFWSEGDRYDGTLVSAGFRHVFFSGAIVGALLFGALAAYAHITSDWPPVLQADTTMRSVRFVLDTPQSLVAQFPRTPGQSAVLAHTLRIRRDRQELVAELRVLFRPHPEERRWIAQLEFRDKTGDMLYSRQAWFSSRDAGAGESSRNVTFKISLGDGIETSQISYVSVRVLAAGEEAPGDAIPHATPVVTRTGRPGDSIIEDYTR